MIEVMPEVRPLLVAGHLMELGPGVPNKTALPLLQDLQVKLPKKAKDGNFGLACLAGLWLYHNFLDESHAISQDLDTIEGSYWHGIMHRREPDFGNAKYWFRRVPRHPVFVDLAKDAATLAHDSSTPTARAFLTTALTWNPAPFVDLCETASRTADGLKHLCQRIQQREWELLFHYCYARAFNE